MKAGLGNWWSQAKYCLQPPLTRKDTEQNLLEGTVPYRHLRVSPLASCTKNTKASCLKPPGLQYFATSALGNEGAGFASLKTFSQA